MSAFYKVVFKGIHEGQANVNILHYRTGIDPFGGLFGIGGAEQLADLIEDEVVPAYLGVKPTAYSLQELEIYVRNETFSLAYQLPYIRAMNLPGTIGWQETSTDGPALCANLRFNLEPVLVGLQAATAPKRGYISVGPITSGWIDNRGLLADAVFLGSTGPLQELAAAVSKDLVSIVPPADFFPIRVSERWGVGGVAGGLFEYGFADVESASFRRRTSFRRSRMVEN